MIETTSKVPILKVDGKDAPPAAMYLVVRNDGLMGNQKVELVMPTKEGPVSIILHAADLERAIFRATTEARS